MSDVFLSYAREERELAKRLAAALASEGFTVFWDRRVLGSQEFSEVIERELDQATSVVTLWSHHSVGSRWVRAESEEGARRECLISVRVEDVPLPLAFRQIQAVDLIGWNGDTNHEGVSDLVKALMFLSGKQEAGGRPAQPFEPGERDRVKSRRRSTLVRYAAACAFLAIALILGISKVGRQDAGPPKTPSNDAQASRVASPDTPSNSTQASRAGSPDTPSTGAQASRVGSPDTPSTGAQASRVGSPETPSNTPINIADVDLQSLNATVTGMRFFESSMPPPPLEKREYTSQFESSRVRYVCWEIRLRLDPPPKAPRNFLVISQWLAPNGNQEWQDTLEARLDRGWTWSYHQQCWGGAKGFRLPQRAYTVVLKIARREVIQGTFNVIP